MRKARDACAGLYNSLGRIRRDSQAVNRAFERHYSGQTFADLPILEVRFPLLDKGCHAFFLVMCRKHALEQAALIANPLG